MSTFTWVDYWGTSETSGGGTALPSTELTIDPDTIFTPTAGDTLYRTMVSASCRIRIGFLDDPDVIDGRVVRSVYYGIGDQAVDLIDNGLPGIMWGITSPEVGGPDSIICSGSIAWTAPAAVAHTQTNTLDSPLTATWPGDLSTVQWIASGFDPHGLANSEARRKLADSGWRPTVQWGWNDGGVRGNGVFYVVSGDCRVRCLFRRD